MVLSFLLLLVSNALFEYTNLVVLVLVGFLVRALQGN